MRFQFRLSRGHEQANRRHVDKGPTALDPTCALWEWYEEPPSTFSIRIDVVARIIECICLGLPHQRPRSDIYPAVPQ
jgi:hypothetical protein